MGREVYFVFLATPSVVAPGAAVGMSPKRASQQVSSDMPESRALHQHFFRDSFRSERAGALDKHPVVTKSISSGLIGLLGDLLAQGVESVLAGAPIPWSSKAVSGPLKENMGPSNEGTCWGIGRRIKIPIAFEGVKYLRCSNTATFLSNACSQVIFLSDLAAFSTNFGVLQPSVLPSFAFTELQPSSHPWSVRVNPAAKPLTTGIQRRFLAGPYRRFAAHHLYYYFYFRTS